MRAVGILPVGGSLARVTLAIVLAVTALGGCGPAPAPAFGVGAIALESEGAEIHTGDAVQVSTRIENTGTLGGTYTAVLTVDGTAQPAQDVVLEPGQARTVVFAITAGPPGDAVLVVGSSTATLTVKAVAVFEVVGLDVSNAPAEIRSGDAVEYTARVRNAGNLAGTYTAELLVDGVVEDHQDVTIEPGQTGAARLVLRADAPGAYDVAVGDQHATLTVPQPATCDLDPPFASPNPADAVDAIEVLVTVANQGGLTATCPVDLKIDGKVSDTRVATVPPGETTTLAFSVRPLRPGDHVMAVNDLTTDVTVWNIQRPANGKVLTNRIKGGRGSLTINNSGERDAVIVLAKETSPSKALVAVYVRAGKSSTVKSIKDGTYIVFFRSGERWDAYSRAFTASQESRRFESAMRFKTTRTSTQIRWSIWSITLHAAAGNAPTAFVGDEEFPAVP